METKPYCTTKSSDCHKTFFNYARPQCCTPEPQKAPELAPADVLAKTIGITANEMLKTLSPAEMIIRKTAPNSADWDLAKLEEMRWTGARKAGEDRRGDMTPGRYQLPIVVA